MSLKPPRRSPSGSIGIDSQQLALAMRIFDQFVQAPTFKSIVSTFKQLCNILQLDPKEDRNFYHHLRSRLRSWKAESLWSKLDKRASHRDYKKNKACSNTRVLIIGGGPCGLRAAIELMLLGAKVVVVEKRDRFSRNNVLHLWPYVIHDLKALGAKKFYGKFCAGSIDHISIRQLQCILLKVALLVGVEFHENTEYVSLIEPPEDQSDKVGWRAQVSPKDHPVNDYQFDAIFGADGKRNTLGGFQRKEFRGKLAIAITANFVNRLTHDENIVEEISGVAFIFNQKFFTDMKLETGIDLENIVYYKDDTHYFVMTAKKQSLIERGVILKDFSETEALLSRENVNQEALMEYAQEASAFATNYQLPHQDFAMNHYGQPDVAMFDFTSMYQAEHAARAMERRGHKLLMALVGDSLVEPFWPLGTGIARGFLGVFDACWMVQQWSSGKLTPLQVLALREASYRLLAQTKPENLQQNFNSYSLDPQTRYINFNQHAVSGNQARSLYDSGDVNYKDEIIALETPPRKMKTTTEEQVNKLFDWCQEQVSGYRGITIENMTTSWRNGLALCATIHRYRPDLIDFDSLSPNEIEKNTNMAFSIAQREFGIMPMMTGKEMSENMEPDKLRMTAYLWQFYEFFCNELPFEDGQIDERPVPKHQKPNRRTSTRSIITRKHPAREMATDLPRTPLADMDDNKRRRSIEIALRRMKLQQELDKEREARRARIEEELGFKRSVNRLGDRARIPGVNAPAKPYVRIDDMEAVPGVDVNRRREQIRMQLESDRENMKALREKEFVQGTKGQAFANARLSATVEVKDGDIHFRKSENIENCDQRVRELDRRLKERCMVEPGEKGSTLVTSMAQSLMKNLESTHNIPKNKDRTPVASSRKLCYFCQQRVYVMEQCCSEGLYFHRDCFRCYFCDRRLHLGNYAYDGRPGSPGHFYCKIHVGMQPKVPIKRSYDDDSEEADGVPHKRSQQWLTPESSIDGRRSTASYSSLTPERVEFESMQEMMRQSEEDLEASFLKYNFGSGVDSWSSLGGDDDDEEESASEESEAEEEYYSDSVLTNRQISMSNAHKLMQQMKRQWRGEVSDEEMETEIEDDDNDVVIGDVAKEALDDEYNHLVYLDLVPRSAQMSSEIDRSWLVQVRLEAARKRRERLQSARRQEESKTIIIEEPAPSLERSVEATKMVVVEEPTVVQVLRRQKDPLQLLEQHKRLSLEPEETESKKELQKNIEETNRRISRARASWLLSPEPPTYEPLYQQLEKKKQEEHARRQDKVQQEQKTIEDESDIKHVEPTPEELKASQKKVDESTVGETKVEYMDTKESEVDLIKQTLETASSKVMTDGQAKKAVEQVDGINSGDHKLVHKEKLEASELPLSTITLEGDAGVGLTFGAEEIPALDFDSGVKGRLLGDSDVMDMVPLETGPSNSLGRRYVDTLQRNIVPGEAARAGMMETYADTVAEDQETESSVADETDTSFEVAHSSYPCNPDVDIPKGVIVLDDALLEAEDRVEDAVDSSVESCKNDTDLGDVSEVEKQFAKDAVCEDVITKLKKGGNEPECVIRSDNGAQDVEGEEIVNTQKVDAEKQRDSKGSNFTISTPSTASESMPSLTTEDVLQAVSDALIRDSNLMPSQKATDASLDSSFEVNASGEIPSTAASLLGCSKQDVLALPLPESNVDGDSECDAEFHSNSNSFDANVSQDSEPLKPVTPKSDEIKDIPGDVLLNNNAELAGYDKQFDANVSVDSEQCLTPLKPESDKINVIQHGIGIESDVELEDANKSLDIDVSVDSEQLLTPIKVESDQINVISDDTLPFVTPSSKLGSTTSDESFYVTPMTSVKNKMTVRDIDGVLEAEEGKKQLQFDESPVVEVTETISKPEKELKAIINDLKDIVKEETSAKHDDDKLPTVQEAPVPKPRLKHGIEKSSTIQPSGANMAADRQQAATLPVSSHTSLSPAAMTRKKVSLHRQLRHGRARSPEEEDPYPELTGNYPKAKPRKAAETKTVTVAAKQEEKQKRESLTEAIGAIPFVDDGNDDVFERRSDNVQKRTVVDNVSTDKQTAEDRSASAEDGDSTSIQKPDEQQKPLTSAQRELQREQARARARMKSDEELGIVHSPYTSSKYSKKKSPEIEEISSQNKKSDESAEKKEFDFDDSIADQDSQSETLKQSDEIMSTEEKTASELSNEFHLVANKNENAVPKELPDNESKQSQSEAVLGDGKQKNLAGSTKTPKNVPEFASGHSELTEQLKPRKKIVPDEACNISLSDIELDLSEDVHKKGKNVKSKASSLEVEKVKRSISPGSATKSDVASSSGSSDSVGGKDKSKKTLLGKLKLKSPIESPKKESKPRDSDSRLFGKMKLPMKKKKKRKSLTPDDSSSACAAGAHRLRLSMSDLDRSTDPPTAEEENLSDDDTFLEHSPNGVLGSTHGPSTTKPVYNDSTLVRAKKAVANRAKQDQVNRLHTAQELQRELEELEVKQKEREERAMIVEQALRGEGPEAGNDEAEVMQEWFNLVHEKNVIVRRESELMIRIKELELEDRHDRLEQDLRDLMVKTAEKKKKSKKEKESEEKMLAEMIEVVEQRDALVTMLEEERLKEKIEDEELTAIMNKKGIVISPVESPEPS